MERMTMKKTLVICLLSAVVGGSVFVAPSFGAAFPQFWTDATKTTLLRSVTALPKNQPDAMEFGNEGPVAFLIRNEPPIECNEVEFGTTVLVNTGALESKLALPFGVAEGDNCHQPFSGGLIPVPTYFDTTAAGVVPATITVTGPPLAATLHKLAFSHNIKGAFCTTNLEGAKGEIKNVEAGFVEESPPNLSLIFEAVPMAVTCGKAKTAGVFFAHFFLETMSTLTDTAFVG
jgi:hypothetical protein